MGPADYSFCVWFDDLTVSFPIRVVLFTLPDFVATVGTYFSHFLLLWLRKSSMLSMTEWITCIKSTAPGEFMP
jgi:hypothetical protein